MPFDYHLNDMADAKSVMNAQIGNQRTEKPLRTSASTVDVAQQSLTSYSLSDAMQGISLYKPPGASYDAFNNHLSAELEGLGTESKWKDRNNRLKPYDIFLRDIDPSTSGAEALGNAAAGTPTPAATVPVPGGSAPIGGNGNSKMIWPTESHKLSRGFGGGHMGLDIVCTSGTTIYSPLDGEVTSTNADFKTNIDGYGDFFLYIKHADDLYTLYGHIKQRLVTTGDKVTQGQPIALSGGNPGDPGHGHTTGAHLHFETRNAPYGGWGNASNPNIIDPMKYLEG